MISDFEDEDFVVWMRTAGLPTFKKLYRIINTDLQPGNYSVTIQNSTRPSPTPASGRQAEPDLTEPLLFLSVCV